MRYEEAKSEGFECTLKSFNFILKTMEMTEGFKHKSYISSVVNSPLLYSGRVTRLEATTGSTAGF